MLTLEKFIHRKILVLKENTSISAAARAIDHQQVGCVLVCNEEGQAVGILTDRDFVCRWASQIATGSHQELQEVPIRQIMSSPLIAKSPDHSLSEITKTMELHGIRRIPIVEETQKGIKKFVGLVTLDDLIAANRIEPHQLARIIKRQMKNRNQSHLRLLESSRTLSESLVSESSDKFYKYISSRIGLPAGLVPKVTQFILGALGMRITQTEFLHLIAQLPRLLQESLVQLPPGPDRTYSVDRILDELTFRFGLDHSKAQSVLQNLICALEEWGVSLKHLKSQLPKEFANFFKDDSVNTEFGVPSTDNFTDRSQAAYQLAQRLAQYSNEHPLVLGIPRGGVPIANIIATQLKGDLDVILVHKISTPDHPEFAIGSVSEFGSIFTSESNKYLDISPNEINRLAQAELARLKWRRQSYSPVRAPISPENRTVIIVDDGVATGATMIAAVRAVRGQNPKRVIIATPIISPRTVSLFQTEVDDLVYLKMPDEFVSISQFYDDFSQVSDEEILAILSGFKENGI